MAGTASHAASAPNNGTAHELATLPEHIALQQTAPEAVVATAEVTPVEVAQETTIQPRSRLKLVTSLIALTATLFISALNTTIVATTVPTICQEFNSANGYAWIGGAYLLSSAAVGPIWAKLSDIWGRKAIILLAVVFFSLSSIICALSTSMTMLIVGRALQGMSGSGLIGITIIISDLFSLRHRSFFIGLIEVVFVLAGGVGPVLGGAFAQHLSWRWAFWIILPPCGLAFVLIVFALDVHNPRTGVVDGLKAVDWAGSLSMLAMLVMFLLGVSFGGAEFSWSSATVICLIVFGAFMSVFFIFSEKKLARYPLIPLGIFTNTSNIALLVTTFIHHYALYAADFYMPLYFQSTKALRPLAAGALVLPLGVSTALSAAASGYYTHRTGRYMDLIWLGVVLMAAGYGLYISWDTTSSLALTCGTQIVAGIGTGMAMAAPVVALQASVPQKDVASASATSGMARNIATVMALVGGQAIFQNGMDARAGQLAAAGLDPQLQQAFSGQQAAASVIMIADLADPVQQLAVEQAFSQSMRGVWILNVALCGVALLSCFFIKRTELSDELVETKTGLEPEKGAV